MNEPQQKWQEDDDIRETFGKVKNKEKPYKINVNTERSMARMSFSQKNRELELLQEKIPTFKCTEENIEEYKHSE